MHGQVETRGIPGQWAVERPELGVELLRKEDGRGIVRAISTKTESYGHNVVSVGIESVVCDGDGHDRFPRARKLLNSVAFMAQYGGG